MTDHSAPAAAARLVRTALPSPLNQERRVIVSEWHVARGNKKAFLIPPDVAPAAQQYRLATGGRGGIARASLQGSAP